MTKPNTIESSLEFDTQVTEFSSLASAADWCVLYLIKEGGWSRADAEKARAGIIAGDAFLVADDGDDWTIRLQAGES